MARPLDFALRFSSDVSGVKGLDKVSGALGAIKSDAQATGKALDSLDGKNVKVDLNADAIRTATKQIQGLQDELARIRQTGIDIDTKPITARITRLKSDIRALKPFAGLEDEAKTSARNVERAFDNVDISSRVSRSGKRGFADFKDEAFQSGRESAASFSSGFSGATDFVQEVAANAFIGFGPAGAAAGLAAAVGIGLVVSQFQKVQQEAEDARKAMLGVFRDSDNPFVDTGFTAISDIVDKGDVLKLADQLTELDRARRGLVLVLDPGDALQRQLDLSTGKVDLFTKKALIPLDEAQTAYAKTVADVVAKGKQRLADIEVERRGQAELLRIYKESNDPLLRNAAAVKEYGDALDNLKPRSDLAQMWVDAAQSDFDAQIGKLGTKAATAVNDAFAKGLRGVKLRDALKDAGLSDAQIDLILKARAELSNAEKQLETFRRRQSVLDIQAKVVGLIGNGLSQEQADKINTLLVKLKPDSKEFYAQLAEILGFAVDPKTIPVDANTETYDQRIARLRAERLEKNVKMSGNTQSLDDWVTAWNKRNLDKTARIRYVVSGRLPNGGTSTAGGIPTRALSTAGAAINLVRVNIAGREVQAVVDDVNARSRSSEMLADLMGVGA